ncbi:uncharacterized protein LOC130629681 [Hydractinia symbiolongicarpus]|uniref:uncharacterized protein LOC130629681 n=1 Tax=Hydractinia symbiolongicarpus TaxID=13093 RepID=UPI00254CD531|nr:uncharacterized protein LOC130629681 [Hydractinia symbiolongicarpus]
MKIIFVVMIAVIATVSAFNTYPERREAESPTYEEGYRRGYADAGINNRVADPRRGFFGTVTKDCSSSVKNCNGCRGYLSSCCSDKNCSGGRRCKRGLWSYSCDN